MTIESDQVVWINTQSFFVPHTNEDIVLYTIGSPNPKAETKLVGEVIVSFALAVFAQDPNGEKLKFVPFSGNNTSKYYERIFEMESFSEEASDEITENIDSWLMACKKAYESETPVFAISFGEFQNNEQPAITFYVRRGIDPKKAFFLLNKYVADKLGLNFKF